MVSNGSATLFCPYMQAGKERYAAVFFPKVYWFGKDSGGFSGKQYSNKGLEQQGGYTVLIAKNQISKPFLPAEEWAKLEQAQKDLYFTVRVGDLLVKGPCTLSQEDSAEGLFASGRQILRVSEAEEVKAPFGRIHYWKIRGV